MLRMQFLYLTLLIGSAVFTILHRGNIAVILFGMVFFLPVFLFLCLLWTRARLSATIVEHAAVCTVNESETYQIKLCNRSILPVRLVLFLVAENCFYGMKQKQKMVVVVPGKTECLYKGVMESAYSGKLKLTLSKIKCYDLFGLFCLPKQVKRQIELLYLPQTQLFDVGVLPQPDPIMSDIFSEEKSGDDPSSIFALREFRTGDNLRQIHWKLSSKQEKWIVKENSFPIGDTMLILLELQVGEIEKTEGLLQAFLSISNGLLEENRKHQIMWFQEYLHRHNVETQEDLFEALGEILSCPIIADTELKLPVWHLFCEEEPMDRAALYLTTSELMPEGAEFRALSILEVRENGVVQSAIFM